ncbi:MAG: sigma-70 family RNA polymerase sigma factor [Clostridiales bacterium]|nr:sigma-70 family RNA polymerase sigma factor [Clostridiales bacterium]
MCVSSYAENRVTAEEKDYINQNHAFREAVRRAQEGDRNARDELVQNNIGLVRSIVYRFRNRGYEAEDLFQVGCIGLIKAIDHFDLSYEVRFSTYAVPLITGEIRRFLRDDGMLKVSRTLKQQAFAVSRAAEQWRNVHGREATLEELSKQTGLPAEDIVLAISANAEVDSLYRRMPGDAGREITLQEQICDEKNEIEMRLNHVFLEQALAALTKEERQLISLRYFHGKTQTETAKTLGMTQVQVSRKEKQLLLKMRAME